MSVSQWPPSDAPPPHSPPLPSPSRLVPHSQSLLFQARRAGRDLRDLLDRRAGRDRLECESLLLPAPSPPVSPPFPDLATRNMCHRPPLPIPLPAPFLCRACNSGHALLPLGASFCVHCPHQNSSFAIHSPWAHPLTPPLPSLCSGPAPWALPGPAASRAGPELRESRDPSARSADPVLMGGRETQAKPDPWE